MKNLVWKLFQMKETPVTLRQLDIISKNVQKGNSKAMVLESTRFLKKEIPIILSKRIMDVEVSWKLERMNSNMKDNIFLSKEITDLPIVQRLSQHMMQICDQLQLEQDNSDSLINQLEKDTSKIMKIHDSLNENVDSVFRNLKEWTDKKTSQFENHNSFFDSPQMIHLNDFLDSLQLTTIYLRTIVQQHLWIFSQFKMNYFPQPTQKTSFQQRGVVSSVCIADIVRYAVEDATAICKDKNGYCPKVEIKGDLLAQMICVESHVNFVVLELSKNAMRAVLERHGALSILPPISIQIDTKGQEVGIKLSDAGGGIPEDQKRRILSFYYTTVPHEVPTYTYSGNFGTPLQGLGCGLPLSRVYTRFMGGNLLINSQVDHGTDVYVHFDRFGNNKIQL